MTREFASPAKICVMCKRDISHEPRVKDPKGRYMCQACLERARRHAAPHHATKPASSTSTDHEKYFTLDDNNPTQPDDVILPEGYDPDLAARAAASQSDLPPSPSNQYLKEARAREADSGGKGSKYKTVGRFACRHCGYDMSGSPSLRCPECGKMNMTPKDDALRETEHEVRSAMYRRPMILMAIGWGLSLIILVLGKAAWQSYVALGAGWLLSIPLGVLTFWVSTLIFLEYDAPWHVTALRLAGINACVMVVDAIATVIGINAFGIVAIALLIMLYMTELELEKWEAIAMAVVGFVIKIALALVLLYVLVNAIGGMVGGVIGGGGAGAGGPAVPLVSRANPNGPIFYDANSDGVDDVTGIQVPDDAVPRSSLVPQPGGR